MCTTLGIYGSEMLGCRYDKKNIMYVVKSKVGARYPVLRSIENLNVSVRSNIFS